MNYRHLLATSCAVAVAAGTLSAPAQAAVDPIGAECRAATAAANMGQPIPNIGKYLLSSSENAVDNGVLRIYAPAKYKPYITQATDQWVSATGGLMRFEYVDQPGYKVVTVREANLGGYVVGRVQGNVNNMELLLNPDILRNGYYESLVMTIAHELGHAMGLAHSCDGALMKDGTNRGKVAKTPQPLDAQVLIQANDLRAARLSTSSATPTPTPTPANNGNVYEWVGERNSTVVEVAPTPVRTTVKTQPSTSQTSTERRTTVIETTVAPEPTPEQPKRVSPLAIILPVAAAAISAIGLGLAFMRSWF
ncbi:zinc-dependent metalloprotease family protein [Corynebacterium haemomassiliense]|uniref:zinc-dependent metalloprotease family protein n=1 Tax=Corynebacterium haemomassiliense TaxID=2754726 RepID=UPI00288AD1CC|nr:zinc-dependent metalloprotease family protein [Corynebacterium haemomassiliense]